MKVFLGFIVESLTIFSLLLAQYSLSEETYKELNEINPVFHDKESILKLINEEELKSPILEKKPTSLPNEIITLSFVGDCTIGGDESYRAIHSLVFTIKLKTLHIFSKKYKLFLKMMIIPLLI